MTPEEYSRGVLKMVIAQICQMIGWHSINSTPLEFLVDLMQEYLLRISKVTHQYAEVLGRTEANLDDLGLAFRHMHVLIPELSEYVRNVDSVPCIIGVPKFPVGRDSHLNFLKPGSQEVVTRPAHVHEHLPAMYPETQDSCSPVKEETTANCSTESGNVSELPLESSLAISPNQSVLQSVFKRPGGPISSEHCSLTKRSKTIEEGRPLREIHSVIMTTSGFLSPAREGKLPEPRTPHPARADSPPSSSYPMVPPELKIEKKLKKIVKKPLEERKFDKENKKKNRVKELFKPDVVSDVKAKKLPNTKDSPKLRTPKPGGSKSHASTSGPSTSRPVTPQPASHKEVTTKTTKATVSRVKPEKTPDIPIIVTPSEHKDDSVDKLTSEPDKQKLNIFKKISKPREDKSLEVPELMKHKELDSRENSPSLIIDENSDKHVHRGDSDVKRDEKKTPRTPDVHINESGEPIGMQNSTSDMYMFNNMSSPAIPSAPKTPEINLPMVVDLKRKKKDRNVRKKEQRVKSPKQSVNLKKVKSTIDAQESQLYDRPKTPQAVEIETHKEPSNPPTLPFPFFAPFPTAPGLIPHPMGHPMFPRYPLPMGRGVTGIHHAMPNLPIPSRFLPRADDLPIPRTKIFEREKIAIPSDEIIVNNTEVEKFQKPPVEKIGKGTKSEKELVQPEFIMSQANPPASAMALNHIATLPTVSRLVPKNEKNDKLEKITKKSKDHKKERKDKIKKKKDKKDKHKIKDKIKVKKGKITKLKEKKEKKEKRKDKDKEDKITEAVPKITLKLGPASPRPPTPDNPTMKKITIKPLIKKPEEEKKRDPSPELAKISALVTRPPKQKVTKLKADAIVKKTEAVVDRENGKDIIAPSVSVDQANRQVWICPACGNQDDGSPMIGCDDCDAWYHWVCVGVQVPPADHEDWYCRLCLAKQQELHHDKKKKKRKKKVKAVA